MFAFVGKWASRYNEALLTWIGLRMLTSTGTSLQRHTHRDRWSMEVCMHYQEGGMEQGQWQGSISIAMVAVRAGHSC